MTAVADAHRRDLKLQVATQMMTGLPSLPISRRSTPSALPDVLDAELATTKGPRVYVG
jgi:hypothetical protein